MCKGKMMLEITSINTAWSHFIITPSILPENIKYFVKERTLYDLYF